MVWDRWYTVGFFLLHGVIQEEVDQDCINIGFGMVLLDLLSDQLNTPDATAPELDFPCPSTFEQLQLSDRTFQRWTVS